MTVGGIESSRDRIGQAVAEAFAAAGMRPETATITPLRALMAAYPLAVEEVDGLTRRTATAHLIAGAARPRLATADEQEPLSGYLRANAAGGWILVNRDAKNPLVRRRFTVAHELGHYLMEAWS